MTITGLASHPVQMLAEYTNATPEGQARIRSTVMSEIKSDFSREGMLEKPDVQALLASLRRAFQVRAVDGLPWLAMSATNAGATHLPLSTPLPQEGLNPLLAFLSLLHVRLELPSLADLAETEPGIRVQARADVDTITLFVKDLGMLSGAHFCTTYPW